MASRKLTVRRTRLRDRWMSAKRCALSVRDSGDYPLPIAFLEVVLHGHTAVYRFIPLGVKGDGRDSFLLVERYVSCGHVQCLQVEPGMLLETVNNGLLNLLFCL